MKSSWGRPQIVRRNRITDRMLALVERSKAARTSNGRELVVVKDAAIKALPQLRRRDVPLVAALDWKQVKGAGGLRRRLPASRAAALPRPANEF